MYLHMCTWWYTFWSSRLRTRLPSIVKSAKNQATLVCRSIYLTAGVSLRLHDDTFMSVIFEASRNMYSKSTTGRWFLPHRDVSALNNAHVYHLECAHHEVTTSSLQCKLNQVLSALTTCRRLGDRKRHLNANMRQRRNVWRSACKFKTQAWALHIGKILQREAAYLWHACISNKWCLQHLFKNNKRMYNRAT